MRTRFLLPALFPALLSAQVVTGVPVKIALQVDPPKGGAPALDLAPIVTSLNALVKRDHLVEPAPGADGWVLEIRAVPMKVEGLLMADTPMRLARLQGGQLVQADAKDAESVIASPNGEDLNANAAGDISNHAEELLLAAGLIAKEATKEPILLDLPGSNEVKDVEFATMKVAYQPPQPPYPVGARERHIQGKVVVELVVGPDGVPRAAAALQGPIPLFTYCLRWAMKWRFVPVTIDGKPVFGRFKIDMTFRLG